MTWLQDELIGEAKEGKRDAARAEKHHAEWAQAQDARDMEAVVGAMRAGWRRPGRNGGLDGDLVRFVLLVITAQSIQLHCRVTWPRRGGAGVQPTLVWSWWHGCLYMPWCESPGHM